MYVCMYVCMYACLHVFAPLRSDRNSKELVFV